MSQNNRIMQKNRQHLTMLKYMNNKTLSFIWNKISVNTHHIYLYHSVIN